MLRRSVRLQSLGYYNSAGLPTICYKESPYKIFRKRRKTRSANLNPEIVPQMDTNLGLDTDSDSGTIVYSEFDLETNADTIPYTDFPLEIDNITHTELCSDSDTETVTYTALDTDSETETITNMDLDVDSDTESIHHTCLNTNTDVGMKAEEESRFENIEMTKGGTLFPKKKFKENISLFFVACLVVFVLAYPIYAMSFPPEEFPASPFEEDIHIEKGT